MSPRIYIISVARCFEIGSKSELCHGKHATAVSVIVNASRISHSFNVSAISSSGFCLRTAAALASVLQDSSSFGLTSSVSSSVQ